MGRVIKAPDVIRRPDRLGHRGRSRLAELLAAREAARGLAPGQRRMTLDLACRVAALIVADAVERDPAVLDRIYDRALQGMTPSLPISIRVHPADRAASGIDRKAGRQGFEVVDDPLVGRGGCVVTWEGARVDASLAALEAALLDEGGGDLG